MKAPASSLGAAGTLAEAQQFVSIPHFELVIQIGTMVFNGSLRYVQTRADFRVFHAAQEQFGNLPFPFGQALKAPLCLLCIRRARLAEDIDSDSLLNNSRNPFRIQRLRQKIKCAELHRVNGRFNVSVR